MKKKKVGTFAKFTMDEMPMDMSKVGDVEKVLDALIAELRELVEDENLRKVLESDEMPEAPETTPEQKAEV